ncbi:nucleotide pyrophosphohydrolase [Natronocalculus amylovorans]|uniref:Nucleotide pyrophosphohydrolase n=1 Tax=Natronocalculus amylovorans TaxID=2917812 RepID=A0AAE3K8K9_9EURY|nr:nucleotide pyrophosphohydrolase [Natronocalculus amylovorans]MCL9817422.1 nucleotide pyrophosphohydrolase [Natronocalculus amylovorans]NUE02553.1 nucleotide pyrophosphohydrolase [Halorubraceae archaeon YAN]
MSPSETELSKAQKSVEAFLAAHELDAPPAYRLLDLSAEVGEMTADAVKSSRYGGEPEALSVSEDEYGDALFSLLAVGSTLDLDAGSALSTSMEKYADRIEETGSAGST